MSKYTREEQIEIVRWAMQLQSTIEEEGEQIDIIRARRFREAPAAPVHQTINVEQTVAPAYPPRPTVWFVDYVKKTAITTRFDFVNKILRMPLLSALISFFGGIVFLIAGLTSSGFFIGALLSPLAGLLMMGGVGLGVYSVFRFVSYCSVKKDMIHELEQDPAYIAARAEAEKVAAEKTQKLQAELRAQQEQFDAEYAAAKTEYETVTIPNYEAERKSWIEKRNTEIQLLTDDLAENRSKLAELYETTQLISVHNRDLETLVWLYDDMSTSEHDIERALDLLNQNRLIVRSERTNAMLGSLRRDVIAGFNDMYSAVERGNRTAEDIYYELGKTRRDMDIANVAAVVQRHHTNKTLKEINKALQ